MREGWREREEEKGGEGAVIFVPCNPSPIVIRAPPPPSPTPPHTHRRIDSLLVLHTARKVSLNPSLLSLSVSSSRLPPTVRLPSCLFLSLALLHPLPRPPPPSPSPSSTLSLSLLTPVPITHGFPPSHLPPSLPLPVSLSFSLSLLSSPTPPPPPLRSLSLGIGDSELCARCPTGRLTPSRRRPRRMPQRTAQDHQPQ